VYVCVWLCVFVCTAMGREEVVPEAAS
jgi:hypothetical protein